MTSSQPDAPRVDDPCPQCGEPFVESKFYNSYWYCPKCDKYVDFPPRVGQPPLDPAHPGEIWAAVERIWCVALLPEGPDVVQRVTSRAIELRGALPPDRPTPETCPRWYCTREVGHKGPCADTRAGGQPVSATPEPTDELQEFCETKAGIRAHIEKWWTKPDAGPDDKIRLVLPRHVWDELLRPTMRQRPAVGMSVTPYPSDAAVLAATTSLTHSGACITRETHDYQKMRAALREAYALDFGVSATPPEPDTAHKRLDEIRLQLAKAEQGGTWQTTAWSLIQSLVFEAERLRAGASPQPEDSRTPDEPISKAISRLLGAWDGRAVWESTSGFAFVEIAKDRHQLIADAINALREVARLPEAGTSPHTHKEEV